MCAYCMCFFFLFDHRCLRNVSNAQSVSKKNSKILVIKIKDLWPAGSSILSIPPDTYENNKSYAL